MLRTFWKMKSMKFEYPEHEDEKIALSRHLPNPSDQRDARRVSSRRSSTSDVLEDAGGEPKNGEPSATAHFGLSANGVQVYFYLFRETRDWLLAPLQSLLSNLRSFCFCFYIFFSSQKNARHP